MCVCVFNFEVLNYFLWGFFFLGKQKKYLTIWWIKKSFWELYLVKVGGGGWRKNRIINKFFSFFFHHDFDRSWSRFFLLLFSRNIIKFAWAKTRDLPMIPESIIRILLWVELSLLELNSRESVYIYSNILPFFFFFFLLILSEMAKLRRSLQGRFYYLRNLFFFFSTLLLSFNLCMCLYHQFKFS